jgi:hypothetical protein
MRKADVNEKILKKLEGNQRTEVEQQTQNFSEIITLLRSISAIQNDVVDTMVRDIHHKQQGVSTQYLLL